MERQIKINGDGPADYVLRTEWALDATYNELPGYCQVVALGANSLGENTELLVSVDSEYREDLEEWAEECEGLRSYEEVGDDGAAWIADRQARGLGLQ